MKIDILGILEEKLLGKTIKCVYKTWENIDYEIIGKIVRVYSK